MHLPRAEAVRALGCFADGDNKEEDGMSEEGTEVVEWVDAPPAPRTLFATDDPVKIVDAATRVANALADVVRKQKLATRISGREHVRVEGWTLLGSMLGVFPVVVWTRELEDGWEARVEARTRDGATVGAAEAECRTSEKTWASRDSYALRSMAQTRATSKALRHPLGFVMTLAGFEATPLEEMPQPAEYQQRQEYTAPNWRSVLDGLKAALVPDGQLWLQAACESMGVQSLEAADSATRADVLKRMNVVLAELEPFSGTSFPPPTVEDVQKAFAVGFDGVILEAPEDEPENPEEDQPPPEPHPNQEEIDWPGDGPPKT